MALEMDRRELQMGHIKFQDLTGIRLIGVGSFSFVRLVHHKPSDSTYALKCMHRGTIINQNQGAHVLSEVQSRPCKYWSMLNQCFPDEFLVCILMASRANGFCRAPALSSGPAAQALRAPVHPAPRCDVQR